MFLFKWSLMVKSARHVLVVSILCVVFGGVDIWCASMCAALPEVNSLKPKLVLQRGHSTQLEREYETVRYTSLVSRAVFSPQNDWFLTSGIDNKMIMWDYDTGRTLVSLDASDVSDMEISPDSRWFATGHTTCTVQIWDAVTCSVVSTLHSGQSGGAVSHLAFSPDGAQLAAIVRGNGLVDRGAKGMLSVDWLIHVWDLKTKQQTSYILKPRWSDYQSESSVSRSLLKAFTNGDTRYLQFMSDGKRLVWGLQNAAVILDAQTGNCIDVYINPLGEKLPITASPAGTVVASYDSWMLTSWNIENSLNGDGLGSQVF